MSEDSSTLLGISMIDLMSVSRSTGKIMSILIILMIIYSTMEIKNLGIDCSGSSCIEFSLDLICFSSAEN